jgi:hypothetical protein
MPAGSSPSLPVPAASKVPKDPGSTATPADVAVFVSGLGTRDFLDPAHVADALCSALRKRAADPSVDFTASSGFAIAADGKPQTDKALCRVVRRSGQAEEAVLEIHHVSPRDVLEIPSKNEAPLRRVFRLLPAVIAGTLIVGSALVRPRSAKSLAQKLQLLFSFIILLVLSAYLAIAVWALTTAVWTAVQGETPSIGWPQWIVLIAAVAAALVPNWQSDLAQASEIYLRMMRHVWTAADRDRVVGFVQEELDAIAKDANVKRIHVVAYSFGSLIALDTLFPLSSSSPAQLHKVSSLTTIGCPFDVIRMLSPSYARDRAAAGTLPVWLNVYAPVDLLASNFYDGDGTQASQQRGLELPGGIRWPDYNEKWNPGVTLNPINFLMLRSLTAHVEYWDAKGTSDNAFGLMVERILKTTPVAA